MYAKKIEQISWMFLLLKVCYFSFRDPIGSRKSSLGRWEFEPSRCQISDQDLVPQKNVRWIDGSFVCSFVRSFVSFVRLKRLRKIQIFYLYSWFDNSKNCLTILTKKHQMDSVFYNCSKIQSSFKEYDIIIPKKGECCLLEAKKIYSL